MKRINKQSIAKFFLLCLAWLITALSLSQSATGQSADENYILKRSYTDTQGNYTTAIQYFDGLGRPYQQVQVDAVAFNVDLVTLTQYDCRGRDSLVWLPVKGADGLALTNTEIINKAANLYLDFFPYSRNIYEPGALDRIAESFGPGSQWATKRRTVKTTYHTNSIMDSRLVCRKYVVKDDYTLEKQGDYPAASLYVTETEDEDSNTVLTFKNSQGQTLLTRSFADNDTPLDTYYVYDAHGMLCYVLPPMAIDSANDDAVDYRYVYSYRYDGRQDLITKQLPGCEKIEYWRDKAGRVALMQDGEMRKKGKFQYYYYDAFGQVTETGVCNLNRHETPEFFRQYTYSQYAKSKFDLSFPNGYIPGGTPIIDREPTTITYYDRYDFLSLPGFAGKSHYTASSENAKGRVTGTVSIVFGSSDTIRTVYHYDSKGRLYRTVANNLVGGYDKETLTYTFTGLVKTKERIHTSSVPGASHTELYTYTYDDWGKLLTTDHKLDNRPAVRLASYLYDELGRNKEKKIDDDAYTTSYKYNIRGWLTEVKSPQFSQQLYYNTGPGVFCYNGNISSMTWQGNNESVLRGYKFAYDGVNRLTSSVYGESGSIASNVNRYNENMSYDKMGNILSIKRYGKLTPSAFGLIDDLSLSYNGNQLRKVSDAAASGTDPLQMHFADGADAQTEYTYDGNGNLTADLNLGIRKIEYNPLNLPQKILFSDGDSIRYLYGADATKLRALHTIGGTTSRTDYAGNRIYADGRLDKILTEEGYIDFTGSTPVYHYFLTDHLGNNRVVMNQDGRVEQVNHYYPFGSLMAESTGAELQPWKFGGKELDTKKGVNWADFGSRQYNTILSRFISPDPLLEKNYRLSPYVYCSNNPTIRIDPDGKHDYKLDKRTGNIKFFYPTDDKFDRVLAFDSKGKIQEVQVQKNILSSRQDKTLTGKNIEGESVTYDASIYTSTDLSSSESMFEFVAQNSSVEWSHVEATREGRDGPQGVNFIATSHDKGHDLTLDYVAKGNFTPLLDVQTVTHSHPSNSGTPSAGDIGVAKGLSKKYVNIKFYIYLPEVKKHVPYTKDTPIKNK